MKRTYSKIDVDHYHDGLLGILRAVIAQPDLDRAGLRDILRQYPKDGSGFFGRDELIHAYHTLTERGDLPLFDPAIVARLRRKPVRTISGVTPVTVLTKPFPCPGECIFCPNDVRMPKSYLSDEPGAQRAEQNSFDPYLQTYNRLLAYRNIGHPTDKVEVIILGGTWSFYPETYQIWFVKRIFDALHDFGSGADHRAEVEAAIREQSQLHPERNTTNVTIAGVEPGRTYNQVVQEVYRDEMHRSRDLAQAAAGAVQRSPADEYATWDELDAAHTYNETAACRCVGLVIETRPDHISADEVRRVRRLGCTKVQIGFQSLNDDVLRLNRRGHDVAATRRAVRLLRSAGFKIHAHWMPNLYGSDPQRDLDDYQKLFTDPDFCPDELKIYPCSLIESAELMQVYQRGDWHPYTHDELLDVLVSVFEMTPAYCRLTRVIRDIPSTDIVTGNPHTNFRQLAERELQKRGGASQEIRSREIRGQVVAVDALHLDEIWYPSAIGEEAFLQYITEAGQIAGFLRLSLPQGTRLTDELAGAAMIREVHVYGQAVSVGTSEAGRAQHTGLGTALIERAAAIATERGYRKLAVISAIGTRAYYRSRGFVDGDLYQHRPLAEVDRT
jgi:elongator complex protein 3